MEHEDAIQMNAVEGYLLHDLTDHERTAFEEHYADCEACFEDVQAGTTFTTTMRELTDLVPVRVSANPYKRVAYAAAASLALSIGGLAYQYVQLAQESQPRIMPLVELRDTRAEEETATFERNARPVVVLTINAGLDSPPYSCKIVDAQGKVQGKPVTIPGEVAVNFDVGRRAPGNYTLIVSGSHGLPVLEKRFTVR